MSSDRRRFLWQAGCLSGATSTGWLLNALPPVSAQEADLTPKLVTLDSGVEPTVRLIEETLREEVIDVIATRILQGLSYQELLAGLLLAGVRNVQPRPSVGFKFHSVLVVNSAHLASLASPDADRWLPILWAIDYFKGTQAEESRKTGWHMQPVAEEHVPNARQARQAFMQAMERWDPEAADTAVAGLARTAGKQELFELFCRLGARDFRSIGHKAIYVANSFRTLECIGWQHAEPVLRSLAFALLNHEGGGNPAEHDYAADRPWRANLELAPSLPAAWLDGPLNEQATRELVVAFRTSSESDMPQLAAKLLGQGVPAQSIWDAVLLASGELLMQQPGIIGLHSLTTANALHYAFQTSGDDDSRRMLLLQACAFVPMFRQSAAGRGKLGSQTIERFADEGDAPQAGVAPEQIFSELSQNRLQASASLYRFLRHGGSPYKIMDEARRLIFLKGSDAHDYKFSSAVLEDFHAVSPNFRNEFLALSVFNLRGSQDRDNQLVGKIRAALRRA